MSPSIEEMKNELLKAMGHAKVRFTLEHGKVVITEERCAHCKGKGAFPLFTTISTCDRCGGTGAVSATIDLPLTEAKVRRCCRAISAGYPRFAQRRELVRHSTHPNA